MFNKQYHSKVEVKIMAFTALKYNFLFIFGSINKGVYEATENYKAGNEQGNVIA